MTSSGGGRLNDSKNVREKEAVKVMEEVRATTPKVFRNVGASILDEEKSLIDESPSKQVKDAVGHKINFVRENYNLD